MDRTRSVVDSAATLSRRQALKLTGVAGAASLFGLREMGGASAALLQDQATEPRPGGSITVVTEADWVDLDPHLNGLFAGRQAIQFAYESLTQFDENLAAAPALAESWETAGNQTFTFKLRQGVTWHDGSPFTAEDVVYSFERVLNPDNGAASRSVVSVIDAMEIVDTHTVRFSLSAPKLFFPEALANLAGTMIIKAGSADDGDLKQRVNGTGPFLVDEVRAGDFIRFTKNPNYWGAPIPYVDELILKLMVEEDTRVAWLRTGQADYIDLYAEAAARLEDEDGVTVLQSQKAYMMGIRLNVKDGPFSDGRVRRALDMAMDRQDMIEKARFGAAELTGFIPTGYGEWSLPADQLPAWYAERDVEGAKQLLADAGYADGFSFGIKCSRPEHVAMALVAKENWKELGIEAEVVQMEYGAYFADNTARNFETIVVGNTFNPDPNDYLWGWYHTEGSQNAFGYSNPDLDTQLDAARVTTDPEQLKQQLAQIQQELWDDGAPYLHAYNALNLEGLQDRVHGYEPTFAATRSSLKQSWVENS
ncbi:MAG: ABC transporter substrate-binding protein [Thermomicrobiales bacterium]